MLFNTVTVELADCGAFRWFCTDNVCVRGYAFVDNMVYEDEELASYFSQATSIAQATQLVRRVDGFFSVILRVGELVFAAVDHLRSMPLFYRVAPHGVTIFDRLDQGIIAESKIDPDKVKELMDGHYVLGNNTIFNEVYQINAGTFVCIEQGKVKHGGYYSYSYVTEEYDGVEEATELLMETMEKVFSMVIKYLRGRTALVPLSGGHDSRLIVYHLYKLGYSNIVAYTYGNKSSHEHNLALQVCERLGIRHHFIECKRAPMRHAFQHHFREYSLFSGNGTSVPWIQELYPIQYLVEKKIIDQRTVVIPGFGGSFTGSLLLDELMGRKKINKAKMIDQMLKKVFWSTDDSRYQVEIRDVVRSLDMFESLEPDDFNEVSADMAAEAYEHFVYAERESKFIQNAAQVYEFWGLQWITPLSFRAMVDFWMRVPYHVRYKNKYLTLERRIYPETLLEVPCNVFHSRPVTFGTRTKARMMLVNPGNKNYLYNYLPISPEYYMNLITKKHRRVDFYVSRQYIKTVQEIAMK